MSSPFSTRLQRKTDGPNAEAIEAWDTVLFDKFVRFREIITKGLGLHGSAALERAAAQSGEHVLDVGCGFGDTTIELAKLVGSKGEAFGVDAAPRFIEGARSDAKAEGIENARFDVRDVQVDPLGEDFDLAFSRMGVMFFANPVQALRNIYASLRPRGRIAFSVWRKREDNPWLHEAERAVREIIPEELEDESSGPTCGPGPFSMSGADLVSDQLTKAGFQRITFERHDAPFRMGRDIEEAIDFAIALGPAGEIIRLAGEEGERRRPEVIAALEKVLGRYRTDDGVKAPASTWLIRADKPG
jgi:SAM-dependent methyltransferase